MSGFGENLRRIRKERKLSMDALAEMAGTSKQVLSRYENGERVPKISMVQKLASALNVTMSELTGEQSVSEEDEVWQIREGFRRNPELRAILSLTRSASKKELKQLEAFIRAIRSSNDYDDDDTH